MADTFDVVGQRPTTQFVGGTETKPAVSVGILTKPSSIYIEFLVPRSIYSESIVNAAALGWANIFETVAALPWVAGVEWSEVPQPSGQLAAQITITVVSSSGNSSIDFDVLVSRLPPNLDKPKINSLHNQLDAAEAL